MYLNAFEVVNGSELHLNVTLFLTRTKHQYVIQYVFLKADLI